MTTRRGCASWSSESDVFSQGYRAGALARRGFGPEQLAELRPGLIYVSINCYGHTGPWEARPGWEQLAQTVTGIAAAEGTPDRPARMPVAACDFTTGYLAALGTLVALGRRAREGGSYHVRASLCQSGMWFTRLGADLRPGPGQRRRRPGRAVRRDRHPLRPPAATSSPPSSCPRPRPTGPARPSPSAATSRSGRSAG